MSRFTKKRAAGDVESAAPEPGQNGAAQDPKVAKQQTKALKAQEKRTRNATKAETKQAKMQHKAAKKGELGRVSPGNAKKILGIARVMAPVLTPFAARAAISARNSYDRMRARKLGVDVDDLGKYSGRGASLHARIAGDADALHDLRTKADSSSADEAQRASTRQFVEASEQRLAQLTSAVRAAERMPSPRRRSTYKAVAGELNRIEDDLMHRLGV